MPTSAFTMERHHVDEAASFGIITGQISPPILLLSVWTGLLTGVGELLYVIWKEERLIMNTWMPQIQDFIWMAPLANLLLFVFVGLVLAGLARLSPRLLSLRTIVFVFAYLSFVSLLLLVDVLHVAAQIALSAGLAVQAARLAASHPNLLYALLRYSLGWIRIPDLGRWKKPSADTGDNHETRLLPGWMQPLTILVALFSLIGAGMQVPERLAERRALMSLPVANPEAPNVLLFVFDTARAKSMSLYGYNRTTTPNLERWSSNGVVFDLAMSTAPWTLPSHASMFTGRWPHEMNAGWMRPLGDKYPTLAEALSTEGYQTAGFVANLSYCTFKHGLDRGFAHYEDFPISFGQLVLSASLSRSILDIGKLRHFIGFYETLNRKSAADINGSFLEWLSNRDEQRPFFAFLNYYDAHDPYLPPAPYNVKFGPERPRSYFATGKVVEIEPGKAQVELDAYEGAIAYLDAEIDRLLSELGEQGILDNTIVIITSDHGEHFGEHGIFSHGGSLYQPLLHVPLLISFPPRVPSGLRITEAVSLRDLPTTVFDLAGLPNELEMPGHSLSRHWSAMEESSPKSVILSETEPFGGPTSWPASKGKLSSLVLDPYKYILNGDRREELYHLRHDPSEEHDLSHSDSLQHVLSRFRTALDTY